ncbi:MAG: ATP-binding protein [Pseudomonadota bacterium]|nr:ATP-binding protein [Pseudomonadota bacterium]
MSIPQSVLENAMFHQNLWWSYAKEGNLEVLNLSEGLQRYLGRAVVVLEDIMGDYETALLRLKIEEALKDENSVSSEFDMRFNASYETLKGKRSFQHQLRVLQVDSEKMVWANCIDVSEMVALEREMVDAQGRMTLSHIYDRQQALEDRNTFITNSYNKQSRFLALLSHELRSPLLGISSLVKRLRLDADVSPEVSSMLKTIAMTAEQSTYLVNDILTYSQTEYDGITLHPAEVSLPELLESVKQLTKSIASDKDLILSLVYLGEHQYVLADGVRLTQILINLIVNGIKFTQYGGVNIEISETKKDCFHFKITDSGEGITEQRQQKIFEPFAQLEADEGKYTTNTRYLGAGLGLFVVRQLVELMGGEIEVTSEVGVGTTFMFELKLKCLDKNRPTVAATEGVTELVVLQKESVSTNSTEAEVASVNSQTAIEQSHLNQLKVLVADDSKINRMVLAGYLADLNCEVVEAKDGREAWELFEAQEFDYVLLDIQMPFIDGVEVSKKIREVYSQGKLPRLKGVFAITAGGDASGFITNEEQHETVGFDEWLVKPVSKNQIVKLLQKKYRNAETENNIKIDDDNSINKVSKQQEEHHALASINDVPKQFHHLFEPFIVEMTSGLDELNELNLSNSREKIKKTAHYLKGNCMLFQLTGLVKLFKSMEMIQEMEANKEADSLSRFEETNKVLQKLVLNVKNLEKSSSISHNKQ